MKKLTKWGLFIGSEKDCEAFIAEMEKRENPASAPAPKEEAEKPKTTAKRKTSK